MGKSANSKNKKKVNKNASKFFVDDRKSLKTIRCKNYAKCGREVVVDVDAIEVICHICVQDMVGIDPKIMYRPVVKKAKSEFPRGWHLYKQYIHKDGRVFKYGKEIKKLKGKFKPTTIKETPKLTRSQRRRMRDEKKEKREARLAKRYKKIRKLKKKDAENGNS